MGNSTNKRPEMSDRTIIALGEMARAVVIDHEPDFQGTVEFTVCRQRSNEVNASPVIEEEFFYAQHTF